MVQKRQLAEEEYDVSPKHLKLKHACDFIPSLQFAEEDDGVRSDIDEGCFFKPISGVDYEFISGKFTDSPMSTMKDVDYTLPGRLSTSSWASSLTTEEDVRSASPLQIHDHIPLEPRTMIHPENVYSYLLGRPPLKEVPIGRDYQANIPECTPLTSEGNLSGYSEHEVKLMGSCVISLPEDQVIHDDNVGRGRTECYCEHPGSLGCVRKHIKEARETLKESIGEKKFSELGFGNMGEVVSEKWTDEDEQLYHEIVYSNPVSVGRNFWKHLEAVFPARTNQEIVSYYFNVFMLRRRAEQNRCDPPNIDSDDDEWQGSDESEDEDNSCQDEIHQYDSFENRDGFESSIKDHCKDFSIPDDQIGSTNFSDSISQPSEKTMVDESGDGDHDFQYDSCTSSGTAGMPHMAAVHADSNKSWGSHGYIFEASDSKVWDIGFFSCPRTKTEFLPTGSMIEEVFGVESWNFEETDDNKSSN